MSFVTHLRGKGDHSVRIIDRHGGSCFPERQMVIDQKEHEITTVTFHLQSSADTLSHRRAGITVKADILRAPGVMKNKGEVKDVGIFDLAEEIAEESNFRLLRVS